MKFLQLLYKMVVNYYIYFIEKLWGNFMKWILEINEQIFCFIWLNYSLNLFKCYIVPFTGTNWKLFSSGLSTSENFLLLLQKGQNSYSLKPFLFFFTKTSSQPKGKQVKTNCFNYLSSCLSYKQIAISAFSRKYLNY